LIRRTAANFSDYPTGLYPGDTLVDKLIRYSISFERWYREEFIQALVAITVFADGMAPQRVTKPMKELANF
jgi:hypothetical protein